MSLSQDQKRTTAAIEARQALRLVAMNAITELNIARNQLEGWLADPDNIGPLDDLQDSTYRSAQHEWLVPLVGLGAAFARYMNARQEAGE